jgi:uncharacterized protein YneF (UPF0154 family)
MRSFSAKLTVVLYILVCFEIGVFWWGYFIALRTARAF